MRKLSEINEGILSKTIHRSKTDSLRKEDMDGMSDSEYELFKVFKEFHKGGKLNLDEGDTNRIEIALYISNQEIFTENLHKAIKQSTETKRLFEWQDVQQVLEDGDGVIYNYTNDYHHFIFMIYDDDKNKIIKMETIFENIKDKVYGYMFKESFKRKRFHEIPYNAYSIPSKVMWKIMKEQGKYFQYIYH